MLTELHIQNFALIDDLTIEFGEGLNIVTGETGAGKSIVIGALQMLLGKRADKSVIRTGADSCELTAYFDFGDKADLAKQVDGLLEAAGAPSIEGGELIVKRIIREKGSRNFINSSGVTVQVLKDIGDLILDVHGPHDHQSLQSPVRQLSLLDTFAGLGDLCRSCALAHEKLKGLEADLVSQEDECGSPEKLAMYRFQLEEITDANIQSGEDEDIVHRHSMMANSKDIINVVSAVIDCVEDEDGIEDACNGVMRHLIQLSKFDNQKSDELQELMESVQASLQQFSDDVHRYSESLDLDPDAFEVLEERLGLLERLKRKYGGSLESVQEHQQMIEETLEKVDHFDEYRAQLEKDIETARGELLTIATTISAGRQKAAKHLGKEISRKLRNLGFEKAEFSVELTTVEPGPRGQDAIEFMFMPNPGEGAKSLRHIASSGEIARVMLAIKAVLATADETPILVFDEIDANVGGETAVSVGEELMHIGDAHQVLCVTHLPQVAAGAGRHFMVSKEVSRKRTSAVMKVLDQDGRVQEIARMLGGEDSSSVVRRHAEELIQNIASSSDS